MSSEGPLCVVVLKSLWKVPTAHSESSREMFQRGETDRDILESSYIYFVFMSLLFRVVTGFVHVKLIFTMLVDACCSIVGVQNPAPVGMIRRL